MSLEYPRQASWAWCPPVLALTTCQALVSVPGPQISHSHAERNRAGGVPTLFSGKVLLVSRSLSGMFLVGALSNRSRGRGWGQIGQIPIKSAISPQNRESPQKNNLHRKPQKRNPLEKKNKNLRATTLQKCGSEFFLLFSLPKVSWNLAWNFGEIFRATFSRVWVCEGKFHQNFTSKTCWKTENFTQISLCWGAALKNLVEKTPRYCRFLSFVVVECVLGFWAAPWSSVEKTDSNESHEWDTLEIWKATTEYLST